MFACLERKYEWYEDNMWSDPRLNIEEKILDVANEKDMLKKYIEEGGWEKIENDDPFHLIEKYEKYDDRGNRVQRIIAGIGDEFTEEVY